MARFELFIPAARSLKDKRRVLRSMAQNVKNKHVVAIAEVDHQDLWQRSAIGVACVSETLSQCRKIVQEVEKTVGRSAIDGAEITSRELRFAALEDL